MKSLNELISERKSIRKYLGKPVEKEKIFSIVEAARLAPSACNKQPWRYIAVDDPILKSEVAEKGLGGAVSNNWAKTAPVIIIVCSVTEFFTHKIGETVQGVQYHLIDLGISMEHLVLKAADLGLGTCYIGWFNEKPIKKILNISSAWKIECLITLGYSETTPSTTQRKRLDEILFFNKQ